MLKLRHLFDDRALAELLRQRWAHDPGPFAWFRISSNAIYPFNHRGEPHYLRFAPVDEKRPGQVAAEIALLQHLKQAGYGAAEPVPALDDTYVVTAVTEWGAYVATAFRGVPGIQLGRTGLDDEIVASYGRALAELRVATVGYRPAVAPWTHEAVLDWIGAVLRPLPDSAAALAEADWLAERFAALPRDAADYGLVHYDFEYDNVFFDAASGRCHAIDFDDAMYHWRAMDIEQALASLADEIEPDALAGKERVFLAAYAAIRPLPERLEAMRLLCRRFAGLYWYARVRRAAAEGLPDEPEWMVGLRANLAAGLAERGAVFGTPLG